MVPPHVVSVAWLRVGLFWLLACLLSWGGNLLAMALMPPGSWAAHHIDTSIPVGLGPLLAGWLVFRRTRVVSWGGTNPTRAWLLLALLPVVWVLVYLTGYLGGRGLVMSVVSTLSVIIYCTGEEWGWRGFLYEALLPLSMVQRVLLTAVLWFGWHFVFYTDLYNLPFALNFLAMIVAGSFGLESTISRTRSVAMVVCFHALTKIGLPQYYLLGMLVLLILTVIRWPKASETSPINSSSI